MDLISTFNPPRLVFLAGQDVWVRGFEIGDLALVIAWLDDYLPGKDDRIMPPRFLSDEAQQAIETPLGWCVLGWAGLRHFGLSWQRTSRLMLAADAADRSRLVSVFLRRRKTIVSSCDREDLGEGWWGPMVEKLCSGLQITIEEVARMTLDQIECLGNQGLENERPASISHGAGQEISVDDVQAMWEAARQEIGGVSNAG